MHTCLTIQRTRADESHSSAPCIRHDTRPDARPPSFGFVRSLLSDDVFFAHAYLKRQAILGLAETGEDVLTLCQTYIGKTNGLDTDTDAINQGVADVIRLHRSVISDDQLRDLIERALGIGSVPARKAFYELGAEFFGPAYWQRAAADNAKSIRDWAAKQLAGKAEPKKRGRRRKQMMNDE